MLRLAYVLAVACGLAACRNSPEDGVLPGGNVLPTVAGRAGPEFADATAARAAYTRRTEDGVLTATLEDAAWLRYAGAPAEVERQHRAYFVDGYTTFEVVLAAKEFTQPTRELFLLEDNAGRRVVTKPVTYKSAMALVQDRFRFTFSLSFQHAITADTKWVRLTRQSDSSTLEWVFE